MPELVTRRYVAPRAGRLSRLRAALRSYWTGPFSLKDPALSRLFSDNARTVAGPVVNEHTAFTCSAVFDAINQIASDVAKLPLNLHKRRQNGGSDHYFGSRTYKLMHFSPNPDTRSMVFRRRLLVHALLGNGYAEIERDAVGRPAALWNIEPHRVEPFDAVEAAGNGRVRTRRKYRIDGDVEIDSADMIHLEGIGWDTLEGFDMIRVARQAIGLAMASEHFAAAFFGNNTTFGGILTATDRDLDDDQAEELQKKLEALHRSADKAFKLLVLGSGFKYDQTGTRPRDAQMKEIRDQQVQEIARFFNMPLHKLKELSRSTNNNIEHQDLEYYKGCISTWLKLCEEEFNAKLIPSLEQGQQFFKHNANAFLRGDSEARSKFYTALLDRGVYNADMVLDLEDMNPQPDGQGQLYLVQGAMVPKDQLVKLTQGKIDAEAKKAEPTPAPVAPVEPEEDPAVTEANDRAATAEQIAAEARQAAEELRARCEALEAAGTTSAEELTEVRASEASAVAEAAQFTIVADELRAQAESLQAAKEAAEAAEAEARAAAAATVDEAQGRLAEAEQVARDAQAQVEAAEARVLDAETRAETLASEAEARQLADAEARQQAEAAAEAARAEAAEAQAEVEALAVVRDEAEAARATAAALEADVASVRQELDELRAREVERMTATIAAHRGLVVDALGRMVRRECEQARSKQATPEKLRRWLGHFPTVHEAICTEALLPAVRAHLAWTGSNEDPVAVATRIVQDHVARFVAQVQGALDTDPEDFHAVLDRVLTRWESERAGQVADEQLVKEVQHVRAQ